MVEAGKAKSEHLILWWSNEHNPSIYLCLKKKDHQAALTQCFLATGGMPLINIFIDMSLLESREVNKQLSLVQFVCVLEC